MNVIIRYFNLGLGIQTKRETFITAHLVINSAAFLLCAVRVAQNWGDQRFNNRWAYGAGYQGVNLSELVYSLE